MLNARLSRTADAHRRGGLTLDGRRLVHRGDVMCVSGGPGGRFDFGDRAARRLRIDHTRNVGQRAQRHQQAGGLRRGELQRRVHARRERHLDGVALEFEVDQVARAVAGQTAQPQLVEVLAQLLDGNTEVSGGLRAGDPWVGLEIRHHVQQSHQAGRHGCHQRRSSPSPAWARNRPSTSSRSVDGFQHHGVGAVTGDVARQPVGGSDVEFDDVAVAAGQLPRPQRCPGAPQRGGPPVGHPDLSPHAGSARLRPPRPRSCGDRRARAW